MSQQDSLTYKGYTHLFFDFSDASEEVKAATDIAHTNCNYAFVTCSSSKYSNLTGKVKQVTNFWISKPSISKHQIKFVLECDADDWLQYHLIRDLPWIDILKYFVNAKERKND